MGFALIFSGQGTQHPAMLPWLGDDTITRSMGERLDVQDWRAALADPLWTQRNANAQILLTGVAIAAWRQIAPLLPAPTAIAGYSVGELPAFSAAGVFDAETALDLARRRAESMDRCAERTPGGMLAVTGLGAAVMERVCNESGLTIAIRNGPLSVVLAGPHASLDLAERALEAQNARCTRLRVGIASHAPGMNDAAVEFLQTLSEAEISKPRIMLFSNAADRVHDADGARHALAAQIANTVRWDECMENIRARNVTCVLEIGPGQALTRMWNEAYPDVPARSCDEFRSAAGVVRWVETVG